MESQMSRISAFVCALVLSLFASLTPVAAQTIIERQVIVQASVGQPGREMTYLNFTNLEQHSVMVVVEFQKEGGDQNGLGFTLPPSQRKSIGFHEADLAAIRTWLGAAVNFSVVIYYEYLEPAPTPPTIAAEMVWYSAAPFRQVDSTIAVVRRSVKW